jgi:hypothetical protein
MKTLYDNYRTEFNGRSNLGYCYKIYEKEENDFLYVGKVFSRKKGEIAAIDEFLSETE